MHSLILDNHYYAVRSPKVQERFLSEIYQTAGIHANHSDGTLAEVSHLSDSALKLVRSQESQGLKNLIEQTKIITANRDRDEEAASSDGDDDDDDDKNNEDEAEEDDTSDDEQTIDIVELLKTQIACLTELGPTLQQNLLHSRNSYAKFSYPPVVPFRLSDPAAVYVSLIRDKFRNAQVQLVNRLGEANWQRHQAIREQLKRSHVETDAAEDEDQTLYYSVFRPHTTFHDSGVGTSVPTHTNHAPSHASFQSSKFEGEHGCVRVPPIPEKAKDGKPFQCHFCGQDIPNIRSRVDWKLVLTEFVCYDCTLISVNLSGCMCLLIYVRTYALSQTAIWNSHNFRLEQHGLIMSSQSIA